MSLTLLSNELFSTRQRMLGVRNNLSKVRGIIARVHAWFSETDNTHKPWYITVIGYLLCIIILQIICIRIIIIIIKQNLASHN